MKMFLTALILATSIASAADSPKPDVFAPIRFLVGEWRGEASGQAGDGTVVRSYAVVLGGRFVEEKNVSTYPAQAKNAKGEVHEHRGFLSYDKARKTLVLRQFHQESFVNTYSLRAEASAPARLVFESDQFENFDNSWKARETYEIVSADEFVEIFELAAPGKPFEIYSRTHLRRVR